MVNVVQYNVAVYGCGLRDLVPLVGIFQFFFAIVRLYADGPSAVVFLLGPPAYTHTITKKLENTNQGNEIS